MRQNIIFLKSDEVIKYNVKRLETKNFQSVNKLSPPPSLALSLYIMFLTCFLTYYLKGTDHVGTLMGLKCVVYYANYRSGNHSSKILEQVVP